MRTRKSFLKIVLFAVAIVISFQSCSNAKNDNKTRIVMVIPASVRAFSEIEEGLKEQCPDSLYSIRSFSAEGEASKFGNSVEDALKTNPDYFVAIGSQIVSSALSERNKEKMPPTVAGSISVPSAVPELVNIGLNPPRNFPLNIVSQVPKVSYQKVLEVILELKPSLQKVGIIYNEAELNSLNMKLVFEDLSKKAGVDFISGAVTSVEDVSKITEKLIRNGAEAIIVPHDKSATAKASTIARLCNEKDIITASLDDGIIEDGIMFAVSVPYIEVGENIGKIIRDVNEKNLDMKTMPMFEISESNLRVFINTQLFEEKGLSLSENTVGISVVKL